MKRVHRKETQEIMLLLREAEERLFALTEDMERSEYGHWVLEQDARNIAYDIGFQVYRLTNTFNVAEPKKKKEGQIS